MSTRRELTLILALILPLTNWKVAEVTLFPIWVQETKESIFAELSELQALPWRSHHTSAPLFPSAVFWRLKIFGANPLVSPPVPWLENLWKESQSTCYKCSPRCWIVCWKALNGNFFRKKRKMINHVTDLVHLSNTSSPDHVISRLKSLLGLQQNTFYIFKTCQ